MVKKRKLKLKSSARKPLIIVGAVILFIIIIVSFYFNRVGELKSLGYSEEAANSIIFKFKYSYIVDLPFNKTLNAAFESDNYIEDNLDNYAKIDYKKGKHLISNINKLLDKGYSNNEISLIISRGDDKSVSLFAKRDKVKYIEEFLEVDYAKLENYDRYLAYKEKALIPTVGRMCRRSNDECRAVVIPKGTVYEDGEKSQQATVEGALFVVDAKGGARITNVPSDYKPVQDGVKIVSYADVMRYVQNMKTKGR